MSKKETVRKYMMAENPRSAWAKGVREYALELLDNIEDEDLAFSNAGLLKKALLNGASDWREYAYGGCGLVYDAAIAERLCTPSEFKKCRGGMRNPNGRENWLDVEARALRMAEIRIASICKHNKLFG